jgi:hypothetical protein
LPLPLAIGDWRMPHAAPASCILHACHVISGYFHFLNVPHIPYKQQAVENQSIICQMKTQPASWTTAAANFFLPCERQISTHRDACINYFCESSLLVSRCGTC